MSDIFISYASEDRDTAQQIAKALEAQGWSVWWDRTIPAGRSFSDVIDEALGEARCVIAIWSKIAVKKNWVLEEAQDGLDRNILVPAIIEHVRPPRGFRRIQAAELIDWDGTATAEKFQKFISDAALILGPPPIEEEQRQRAEAELKEDEKRQQAAKRNVEEEKRQKARAPEPKQQKRTPSFLTPGAEFSDTLKDGFEGAAMVIISAGTFRMGDIVGSGSQWELPARTVSIAKTFSLGKYAVTFDEYDRFARATSRDLPDDEGWGRGKRPVVYVSWDDAVAYASWLSQQTGKSYRLPSESEWEYAARGGGKEETWAGTSNGLELSTYAWYSENSGSRTHPVGNKQPNGLGLYDMTGNVWEWVQDCWHVNYKDAPSDGSAWLSDDCGERVIRGGSWGQGPRYIRSSYRDWNSPDYCLNYIGFRLAQDID